MLSILNARMNSINMKIKQLNSDIGIWCFKSSIVLFTYLLFFMNIKNDLKLIIFKTYLYCFNNLIKIKLYLN